MHCGVPCKDLHASDQLDVFETTRAAREQKACGIRKAQSRAGTQAPPFWVSYSCLLQMRRMQRRTENTAVTRKVQVSYSCIFRFCSLHNQVFVTNHQSTMQREHHAELRLRPANCTIACNSCSWQSCESYHAHYRSLIAITIVRGCMHCASLAGQGVEVGMPPSLRTRAKLLHSTPQPFGIV